MRTKSAGNGIPPPNYTQVPNIILDSISKIEGAEFAVMMTVCRLTFGWHQTRAEISLSDLTKATGYTKTGIVNAVKALEQRGWIKRTKKKQGFIYEVVLKLVSSVDRVETPEMASQLPTSDNSPDKDLVNLADMHDAEHIEDKERLKETDPAGADPEKLNHKLFVETWCKEYPDFFSVDYTFQGGKDGAAVKRLIKVSPVADLIRVAKIAWRNQGTYPFKCATSISMFGSHINEIRAAAQKLAPLPTDTKADDWTPEELNRWRAKVGQ